ncbi:Phosphoglycolate phosphatase [Papilio machaon]|uniref:Phosphoglycolate phosphatase n=1 Tax=Papilio machaon TaxID=76193 RepID=A0A194QPD9_PAPMA|nr:Phosphoglycolate phosphatase [Papilio machaon]
MGPMNLMSMSTSDLNVFLDSFDHVFSDCDGVIWAKKPLPGSGEFFERMQQLGKTVHFVSNNSMRTRQNYENLFAAANISEGFEKLTIPSTAIAEYLKAINFSKTVFCVTCPETMNVLQSYGFTCKYGPEVGLDLYTNYNKYLEDDTEVGAVVFDSDFNVNLPKMYQAITYLARPDVLFISGATDRHVPLIPGRVLLGTGIFTDIVSEEANRKPTQLAKPGKLFGEFAMKRAGVTDPSRVLFIGDMIEQDIGLGKATGFKTLLVLTNNTYEDMKAHKSLKPDFYADSLGSLVPVLNKVCLNGNYDG